MNKFQKKLQEKEHSLPLVMGILNLTPDSFSDGGQFTNLSEIKHRVATMIEEGVDIIDVGGESTRPGAKAVSESVELNRILPAIAMIIRDFDIPISVDTYKTKVMQYCIEIGVDLINDTNALQSEGAMDLLVNSNSMVCLMHKQGASDIMQDNPTYDNVVKEVFDFLHSRKQACIDAGIKNSQIIIDPGFGFGKNLMHNTQLFKAIGEFKKIGVPVLVGVSRKRMIAELLGLAEDESRLTGSVVASLVLAMNQGATIVRVHDVKETVHALKLFSVLQNNK